MYQSIYTPDEIARMKAQLEQSYQNAALQNQNINTATNMTKSLSPMANLGILLGTLGGKWGAQRLNDIWDARIDKGASLEKSFTNGLPASLRNLGRNIYTTPTSIDVAPALTQQNTNYNPVPSTALNPTQTNLMPNFNSDMNYKNTVLSQNEKDRWSKTPAGQFQGWKDLAKIVGIPENEIDTFAANMVLSQNGRGSSNTENDKAAQVYRETIQTIGGQFIRAQNAIERGDMEKAKEILSGIDTLASDMTFKNLGVLEPDDMKYIDQQLNIYGQVINGEITLDKAKEFLGGIATSNYRGGNDQEMAHYQNNPDELNAEIDAELARREQNKNAAEQQRQNADKAAQIQNEYGKTGIYQNPNAENWEMPEYVVKAVKTPRISVDSAGNRTVTNWTELTPEQKMELLKNGYNGGGYYAGR